jgi:hypothetical protein
LIKVFDRQAIYPYNKIKMGRRLELRVQNQEKNGLNGKKKENK